jgi:hypothetical protein
LHRSIYAAARILQELHGREAHGGAHQVDEAGDEKADAGFAAAVRFHGEVLPEIGLQPS